jgi:GntR family transcriptional regulator
MAAMPSHRAAAPLHAQVASHWRQLIVTGALQPGEVMPSEAELAVQHGVSRSVVRQALATLTSEGLVLRSRGRGTVVAPRRQLHRLAGQVDGLAAQVADAGLRAGTRVLSLEPVAVPPPAADALGEGAVWELRRLRSVEGQPAALIHTWLRGAEAERLDPAELHDGSLHDLLRRRCGLELVVGPRSVRAVAADAEQASLLRTRTGAPLLLLEGTTCDRDGQVVEVFATWHRGDMIAFDIAPATAAPPTRLRRRKALKLLKQLEQLIEAA